MKKVENKEQLIAVISKNRSTLAERFGVSDIAVFGSYIHGTQHRGSDIDILVELNREDKTFDNYMELKFFLSRVTGGKVDLVLKDAIRKELKQKLLAEAVYV